MGPGEIDNFGFTHRLGHKVTKTGGNGWGKCRIGGKEGKGTEGRNQIYNTSTRRKAWEQEGRKGQKGGSWPKWRQWNLHSSFFFPHHHFFSAPSHLLSTKHSIHPISQHFPSFGAESSLQNEVKSRFARVLFLLFPPLQSFKAYPFPYSQFSSHILLRTASEQPKPYVLLLLSAPRFCRQIPLPNPISKNASSKNVSEPANPFCAGLMAPAGSLPCPWSPLPLHWPFLLASPPFQPLLLPPPVFCVFVRPNGYS